MDHSGDGSRHSNVPMTASYVYNGYVDQARGSGSGSGPVNASLSSTVGARPGASRGNFGTRPMSMLAASAVDSHAGSPYMDMAQSVDFYQHAMTAPNTAASDHSFHTIMISDGSHPSSRAALPAAAVPASARPHAPAGIQIRQKRGSVAEETAGAAGSYDGLLSSSLPSGGPRVYGELPGMQGGRAGPDHTAPYPRIAYPPLSATIPRSDYSSQLSSSPARA
ncbi:hypothetical protein LPJ61_003145, partial [Coemansia biformis]